MVLLDSKCNVGAVMPPKDRKKLCFSSYLIFVDACFQGDREICICLFHKGNRKSFTGKF